MWTYACKGKLVDIRTNVRGWKSALDWDGLSFYVDDGFGNLIWIPYPTIVGIDEITYQQEH
jgi:hypothetical protein